MAIIPITIYGNKILRQKAKHIKNVSDETITKIRNMFDSMRNANGVGLAANQVGYHDSMFVIDLQGVEGYDKFKPIVCINPEILIYSDEKVIFEEGCLSLPSLRADVERSERIKLRYLDTDEKEHEIEADDFFARVILHEYDHLIGKMIPDRVDEELQKEVESQLKKIINKEIEIDYPVVNL